jgi:hypothetical protein
MDAKRDLNCRRLKCYCKSHGHHRYSKGINSNTKQKGKTIPETAKNVLCPFPTKLPTKAPKGFKYPLRKWKGRETIGPNPPNGTSPFYVAFFQSCVVRRNAWVCVCAVPSEENRNAQTGPPCYVWMLFGSNSSFSLLWMLWVLWMLL